MSENTSSAPAESTTPAQAEAPAPSSAFEVLTPEEREYFESGGEKTEGLFKGLSESEAVGDKTEAKAPLTPDGGAPAPDQTTRPDQTAAPAPDGDAEPGEITLDEDGKARDVKGRFVPHAALHQERMARKELAAQVETLRQDRARESIELAQLKERLAIMNEALAQGTTPPPGQAEDADPTDSDEPIDPEVDIFGAFKQMQKQLVKERAERDQGVKRATETAQLSQTQLAEQQLQRAYQDDALHYAQSVPDFGPAYQHLSQARRTELEIMGMMDKAAIQKQLIEEERAIVIHAVRTGRRPADMIYNLAKAKGFRGVEAPPVADPEPAAKPAPAAAKNGAAMSAVTAAEKAQRAAATLSGGGGGSSEAVITAETLANMGEREFESFLDKHGVDKVNKILGR
jgi:hypothetical protein